ncbi:MAG: 2Fe-2S iron-sulfur cluster-binding protein [Burkholderiales bacterium]
MTALQLLALIVAALLMQLALGIAVVVRRRQIASSQASVPAPDVLPKSSGGAWTGWRDFQVARRSFEDAAHSQCSFHLQPVDGLPLPAFLPGQFLTFSLPADGSNGGSQAATPPSITRCYSVSDGPNPTSYRITIKRVPAPSSRPDVPAGLSSTHFHDRVHEGTILKVKAPAGHFFIDADASVPVVLVAGGIGITPLMSMLRWCVTEQPARTVHLYYGVRNGSEHAFRQSLEQLAAEHPAFHLNVVYSQPSADDRAGREDQPAGRVDVELLRRRLPHGSHQFYVCGPPAMMESLVPALVQWGVPPQDIHFEAFGPASVKLPGSAPGPVVAALAAPIEVKFSRSGRTLAWDGQDADLLDFTDRHGLAMDSGCRSGSCGTCETRLVSGSVLYDNPPDHDIAPGHCLLCVGRPASALVLEA